MRRGPAAEARLRDAESAVALEKLKPGDIIHVPTGKYAGLALVLDPGLPAGREEALFQKFTRGDRESVLLAWPRTR